MALNFTSLDSYRTVQVLSSTTVQDVQYVTAQTNAHSLGFAYPVPLAAWQESQGVALLTEIATALEDLYAEGHVNSATPSQDIDENGLLVDNVDVTVVYTRTTLPNLYGAVSIPVESFTSDYSEFGSIISAEGGTFTTPADYVSAEYARLQQLAGP
jgi:hypothetical protein